MLKVCVFRRAARLGKPTDLVRLELTTILFTGICSTTELPVHSKIILFFYIVVCNRIKLFAGVDKLNKAGARY